MTLLVCYTPPLTHSAVFPASAFWHEICNTFTQGG